VRNGLVSLLYKEQHVLIPFDLQMEIERRTTAAAQSVFRFTLQLLPQGEELTFEGFVNPAANTGNFLLAAPSLDLQKLLGLTGIPPPTVSMGKISLKGRAQTSLLPFQLTAAELTGDLESMLINDLLIKFDSATGLKNDAGDIILQLSRESEQWQLNAAVAMSEPLALSLELNSSATFQDQNLLGSGDFSLKTLKLNENQQLGSRLTIKNFPEIGGNFTIEHAKNGNWLAGLRSRPSEHQPEKAKQLQVLFDGVDLESDMPALDLQGAGNLRKAEVDLKMTVPGLHGNYNQSEFSIPLIDLQASVTRQKESGRTDRGTGSLTVILNKTQFNSKGVSGHADISLLGDMVMPSTADMGSMQSSGTVTVTQAELTDRDNNFIIKDIEGKIPWQWPFTSSESHGIIKTAGISFGKYDLGDFQGDLRLQKATYFLTGSHTSSLVPGIVAEIDARAELTDSGLQAELTGKIAPTSLASLHLGRFHTALDKSYFSGELGLESTMRFQASNLQGEMLVKIEHGRFEFPGKKYQVENIDFSLLLPALPDLRSLPAQKIFFSKASAGDLVFERGKIVWQLESPESIFIEESMFHWAGGRIFTNAIRITPEIKDLQVPIFCDRINLADLLKQFGISNARGEGTVNGRIPLIIGKNKVHFEDGFLYSSPGHGGSVKVAAFDTLAAGIPKNSPQFAQIDFAAEALKNFSYNWVKLLFNSEGEELVVQMQMDGKPVQSLPFRYDSRTGSLQRIEDGGSGIDRPIRLDVNFRLPLNRFLGYSGRIQDIMEQIQ